MGGRTRHRKPRNSATFQLCPRPGAAHASNRVLVRVDGDPYYLPGFADDEYDGYRGASSSSYGAAAGYEDDYSYSSSDGGALPDHVRREILDLGLPDDGYNYLAHIREFQPSFSSTGGGGSSAAFIPRRRPPPRSGLPLSVKAYDARSVEVGADNVAAAAVVAPVEQVIDPDVTKLLEEGDAPDVPNLPEESDVPQGTSEDVATNLIEENDGPQDTSEDEELEEDFVMIANQSEDDEQMDLEDDFVILANQPDGKIEMLSLGMVKA
ncbi:protein LTV1 homolog [Lolium rigidum]|uniref:protein LTV1 homolog n=1 Tax=Lolium rigidum TaxID=89674 RepID=UPI001F5D4332|nr:protein LTV1 homolog [Lolium rigidum]